MNLRFLKIFRTFAHIEGSSTLLLFGVAMPLKYFADLPIAVKIMGPIHGFLFLGLVVMCLLAIWLVPIGLRLGLAGIGGAIIPFGPFVVDIWLKKIEVAHAPKTSPSPVMQSIAAAD